MAQLVLGRAVASDTRGLQFESSHRQKFINIEHLYSVNCVLKDENKEKEAGNGPFKKRYWDGSSGLVVTGGSSCSEGCGFESHHHIHFLH